MQLHALNNTEADISSSNNFCVAACNDNHRPAQVTVCNAEAASHRECMEVDEITETISSINHAMPISENGEQNISPVQTSIADISENSNDLGISLDIRRGVP